MAKQRDPWFDNAKMTLVTLIVVGHAWVMLPKNTSTDWLYDFLYSWHVPAFVIITGYLSRSFTWERTRLWSLVKTVVVPYVIFEAALAAFRYYIGNVEFENLFLDPHWPMWYLSAMFFWRMMTPIFKAMPPKVAVGVAVPISLAAGLWAGDTFDFARVFGLLPFFVLGLSMRPEHWEQVHRTGTQIFGLISLVGLFLLTHYTDALIETEWLYYRSRYDALEPDNVRATLIRGTLLFLGLAGSLGFYALVPRLKSWFTGLGKATLVVYLFHGFFILTATYAGFPDWADEHWLTGLLLTTVLGVLLALFLAWPPIADRLNYVVDPIGSVSHWRDRRRPQDPVPSSA